MTIAAGSAAESSRRDGGICRGALLAATLLLLSCTTDSKKQDAIVQGRQVQRPNILLIVADDLGYTDLGAYGSEIATPNLDALAHAGILFTNFHSAPTCSPARAMLLSGTDNHLAGLGAMAESLTANQKGHPGYEGYLNFNVAALSELLHDGGYHTYMAGKWHLGLATETGPAARGFEKSFALMQAAAGQFGNMLPIMGPGKALYMEDGRVVESLPDDFYAPRFYARRMIRYIEGGRQDGRPFLGYLAFTTPHWPLQAPDASITRQRGRYDSGFDALYAQRMARLEALGLIPAGTEVFPPAPGNRTWEELSRQSKRAESRRMEIYAAMIADMDRYVGEVVAYLKRSGQFANTLIFFLSDNGAEGHDVSKGWPELPGWLQACCDNRYQNMGRANSYLWLGPEWGRAAVGPWRMFKGFTSEGGIRVPAFVHYPGLAASGTVDREFLSVMDVMPTLLDAAGVRHPGDSYRGHEVEAMQGSSMWSMLRGQSASVHPPDYVAGWELFGKRAVRLGDWKLVYEPYMKIFEPRPPGIRTNTWQLYNLARDPAEMHDVAAENPQQLQKMLRLWDDYAARNHVILPENVDEY